MTARDDGLAARALQNDEFGQVPLWRGSLLPLGRRSYVGAVERSEAAIFPLTIESKAKDQNQKIAAFRSSYRSRAGASSLATETLDLRARDSVVQRLHRLG